MILLVGLGGVLAIEYTAPPLKLKYRALGDLAVLLAFGFGMILGSYAVMSFGSKGPFYPPILISDLCILPSQCIVGCRYSASEQSSRSRRRPRCRCSNARKFAELQGF